MSSAFDLIELSRQLKQEKLFIDCERHQLQQLNTEVSKTADSLYCLSWITRQQKANLNDLVRASREVTPVACCQKANSLEIVKFIDGYKSLTYHEAKIGELLKTLRGSPKLLAAVLMHAETQGPEALECVAHAIMSGVYGNVVMQEDESLVLQVLKALIEQQLAVSDNPRKLLRKESSAFGVFFQLFIEGLFSARLFLTAALHKPVMQLLMEDEWFYDIDPQRALHRFPPAERLRRFGTPETPEYALKTEHYRNRTATKLMNIAERFIVSIKNNMYCFPQSLCWLVSQLFSIMTSRDCVTASEARAMCADLVLALFICPAICDPEPLGITSDAPISYIARHNLMQVAQMLQVLAISTFDVTSTRQNDIYSKFDKECMLFLLNGLLSSTSSDLPPAAGAYHSQMIQRTAMYMTMAELRQLLNLLRAVLAAMSNDDSAEKQRLVSLLDSVPSDSKLEEMQTKNTPNTTPHGTPPGTPASKKKSRAKDRQVRMRNLLTTDRSDNGFASDGESCERTERENDDVILISLGVINECPGMEAEEKIVEQENRQKKSRYNSVVPGEDDPISESEILANEKRTRFSLSHDQDSIATSDNLEAISEAASSHSVGSDIENDNLSDMVSANVSGRGTPSISGRDTPLSQVTGETDSQLDGQVGERRAAGPDLPVTVHKNNREDVTDKFQKFEIEREEIKSTVSDTWSTDVLASDSEPPEQNQMDRLDEIAEEMVRQNLLGVHMQEACEALETASDAWSTDVLASDTSELQVERLLELEQEEVSSVSSRSQLQDEADANMIAGAAEETPQPSSPHSSMSEDRRISADFGGDSVTSAITDASIELDEAVLDSTDTRDPFSSYNQMSDSPLSPFNNSEADRERERKGTNRDSDPNSSPRQPISASDLNNLDTRKNTFFHSSEGAFREVSQLEELSDNEATKVSRRYTNKSKAAWDDNNSSAVNGSAGAMNESTNSMDSVASQLSIGLKLTDQQNLNIDEKRLSFAIDVFDPLAPDAADMNQSELSRSPAAATTNQNIGKTSPHGKINYNEQGARPKITLNNNNQSVSSSPRNTHHHVTDVRDRNASARHSGSSPNVRFHHQRVSHGSGSGGSANLDGSDKSDKRMKPEVLISLTGDDLSYGGGSSDGMVAAARSGSSPPEGSGTAGGGGVGGFMTPPLYTPESSPSKPENHGADERSVVTSDKKKSYSGGIFKSFKDKLSKSSFSSGSSVYRSGGKTRKSLKSHDKEERSGTAIQVDADKTPTETSDDILAKYRRSAPTASPRKSHDVTESRSSGGADADDVDSRMTSRGRSSSQTAAAAAAEDEQQAPAYDPNNLENCKAFLDAKKKLRLVLSTADFQAIPLSGSAGGVLGSSPLTIAGDKKENELVSFLRAQLAEAINLQDKDLIARLHETIRCLTVFSNYETKKLLKSIREEHRSRSPYTSYLIRCRQGLLGTQSHLERLLNRVQRDKTIVNKYFLAVNVRMFLEKREKQLVRFIQHFQEQTLSDEKTDVVEQFLFQLHTEMNTDPVWQMARDEQVKEAEVYIERYVMSHIYTHAMYPNGDGDMARDQILSEHMKKLSQVITPNHKDMRIAKMYHYECPWPAAQNEIYMINAYKTPKDKLQCVLRCSSTIMNLLSLANEKSVPAADDFMPVLIYVIIKANPPSLLSTVQYVTSFYEARLQGEEHYWWMQFTSAIEFIKNMDYDQ